MAQRRTEAQHQGADRLDAKPPLDVLSLLAEAQVEAAAAVKPAIEQIAAGARLAADTLSGGGRLAYAGAGSSGLMALADALELPGTYGIARDRILILLAGGASALTDLAGAPEDGTEQAARDVASAGIGPGDCLIAVTASGSTPYAVAALDAAKRAGASVIGIANNPGTPLLQRADVAILLATPPEVIAGSTRMGAGTAQKIALNMLSTLTAIHLGHVHDGYMVNLQADNAKLRDRAARIVAAITDADHSAASAWLEAAGGSVKTAILIGMGAGSAETAARLLESTGQKLRPALSMLQEGSDSSRHNGT